MKNSWLHRCAILLAVLTFIVITLGAWLTSETRTLPGAPISTITDPGLRQVHMFAATAVAIFTLGIAVWLRRVAGWAALGAAVAVAGLGTVPVLHALVAPVFFSLVVAVAVTTSESWAAGPQVVTTDWAPLRLLATAVPVLILVQIGLGAAFRHNAMGVISHILNALIVLAIVLVAGIFVLRQYPEHPALRPAAREVLIATGVQVLLGFAVYLVLLMASENNMGLIVTGVLHVVNGSVTLAAGLVLAMQVRRHVVESSPR